MVINGFDVFSILGNLWKILWSFCGANAGAQWGILILVACVGFALFGSAMGRVARMVFTIVAIVVFIFLVGNMLAQLGVLDIQFPWLNR